MIGKRTVLTGLLIALLGKNFAGQSGYVQEMLTWRKAQEADIRGDSGWLTVVGLFWLKPGSNEAGSNPALDIALPPGSAPARLGTFEFQQGKTIFRAAAGAVVTSGGRTVRDLQMRPDTEGPPTVLETGSLSLLIIHRGQRYGVRVRDRNSAARREFTGLRWFPIEPSWRIEARFVAYTPPRENEIVNVLGDVEKMTCPGYALFEAGGKEYRLEPVLSGKDQLFFIFGDRTNRKTTYPAGRFLYTPLPREGQVQLDFNQAINPPCAFTPFATCPLPPPQNRLELAIEAGELALGGHGVPGGSRN